MRSRANQGHSSRRFSFLTELQLRALPPLSFTVDGVLPAKSLAVVYGAPEAGKTFVTLDLCLSVATGSSWNGRAVTQGRVLYVFGEGGAGLKDRVAAWMDAHDLTAIPNMFFLPEPVQLLSKADTAAFADSIREYGMKPDLIVFDTLARCFDGDENSAESMGRGIAALGALISDFSASVILVHHTGKSGEAERGSSALRGAADAMIHVQADGQSLVTLRCAKMKDAARFPDIALRREVYGPSCVLVPASAAAPRRTRESDREAQLLALLQSHRLKNVDWRRASGLTEATFHRAKTKLLAAGHVVPVGNGFELSSAGHSYLAELITSSSNSSDREMAVEDSEARSEAA